MIMINHTNPWYLNGLAAIELALFNYTEDKEEREQLLKNAEEAYKTASEVDALNPLFQMSLAFYYHRSGRVEEAYKLYSRSVELDDWFVEAYNNMAEIELGRGNREKAMTYFEEMARADDENFSPETKLFNHWVKGGNFKNYRSKLGELHLLRKNYDQAIIHFKKALEKRENDEKVWRSLGTAYHQSKQMELAIYAYKQALTLNPDLMDVYKYLGYAYYNVGLFNSSQENLVKYLKSNPEDQKVVDDLGRIRQSLRKRRR